jgi:hypothetical protein
VSHYLDKQVAMLDKEVARTEMSGTFPVGVFAVPTLAI